MTLLTNRHTFLRNLALALALTAAAAAPTLSPTPYAVSAASAPSAMTFDRLFIDMMVPHHMGAVAMARIAVSRTQHPQLRRLAQSIIADQEHEIMVMKNWRVGWYGSAATPNMMHMPGLPGLTMHMDMMGEIDHLKTAIPFDKAFIDAMIPHHRMAIEAATLELTYGTHAKLKALAVSIIASQAREIGLMDAYRELWYNVPA